MARKVSRRGLFALGGLGVVAAGATGYALVDAGKLPGKAVLDRHLGRCDAPAAPAALRATPGPTVTGGFRSSRRREVAFAISYPPGYRDGAPLAVCVLLHGYRSTARDALTAGDYPQFIAGMVRDGAAPFAIAAVDGGDGYWHPHATDDPLGMVLDEFIPLLRTRGLDTDRIAVAGWSMGGYGAMLCGLTRPGRFRAIVATSPAVFHSYADVHRHNAGAFDSSEEYHTYDVVRRATEFAGLPLRIAIGAADPFAEAVRTLRDRLPDPSVVRITTGCHDNVFWASVAPEQVRAIGAALNG